MITPQHLANVNSLQALAQLFHDELNWPSQSWNTFAGVADLYGIDKATGVESILAVQQLSADQTWGIFLVDYGNNRLRRSQLRSILNRVAEKERQNHAERTWAHQNVLFVCRSQKTTWTLGHYTGDKPSTAKLKTFGWSNPSESRTVCKANLPALDWYKQDLWGEAWSIRRVTDEFFDTYQTFFQEYKPRVKIVLANNRKVTKKELEDIQNFVLQRAMNRLLFLVFLAKKGWLEFNGRRDDYLVAVFEEWKANPRGERFYENRLAKLFFEALCQKRTEVRSLLEPYVGKVPYLNGGLFERQKYELPGANEDIAILPEEMFETLLGPEGILTSYNFTVVESYDETDEDIAVDPEMLGRIFERLVLDREKLGKFYTPRTIVRFMCRESLKIYLGPDFANLIDANGRDEKKRQAEILSGAQLRNAIASLRQVRIVDPACGSGAYLLGVLHELFEVMLAIEIGLRERTEAERYELKLNIIEQNIYGVDMDEFATGIAMLRLWLSLVVDSDLHPLEQPAVDVSLPNLRFKIRNGDSLSAPNPKDLNVLVAHQYTDIARELGELHAEFFLSDQKRARTKVTVEADINTKTGELRELLEYDPAPPGSFDWRLDFAEVFAPQAEYGAIRGFDIVLANPPYGVAVGDDVRYRYFNKQVEGSQSKDSYGIFMARALELMRAGGTMCYIVSDTWRTIQSHLPLRKRLIRQATIHHFIDLPSWIFEATVNTNIITVSNLEPTAGHELIASDLRAIPNHDWQTLEANLRSIADRGADVQTLSYARYSYPQFLIGVNSNYSFFVLAPRLYGLTRDVRSSLEVDSLSDEWKSITVHPDEKLFCKLGGLVEVKVGLQTGKNEYYLRKREGVRGSYAIVDERTLLTDEEITSLTPAERLDGVEPFTRNGRCFVPYDKGGESDTSEGWLPNYLVPTQYFIDWSIQAVHRMKTLTSEKQAGKIASRFQNSQYYFVQGITWSDAGVYSPTVRLSGNGVFDVKGSRMISNTKSKHALLGLLCSRFIRFLIKGVCNHTVSTQVDDFRELPIPTEKRENLGAIESSIEDLVLSITSHQATDARYPYHANEQVQIDELVYQLYGLSEADIRDIELWFCRRYPKLAEAQGLLGDARERYADHLASCQFILSRPRGYWHSHPILKEISKLEGQKIEFKESYSWDVKKGEINKDLRHEVLRTISAFRNTQGGQLFLGVHDSGQIKGLARDYKSLNKDDDSFERTLRDLLKEHLDPRPQDAVTVEFHTFEEGKICVVGVPPASRVVQYVVWNNEHELWIREGNRSRKLSGKERDDWVVSRGK